MASEAERAIEAILMVAQEPVEPHLLAQLLELSPTRIGELCAALAASYEAQDRGFVLVMVAGGYRFQSHGDLAPYVERFVLEGQSARLSSAALETLAIVAYKQPMSRAQVAAIRGVNVDGVMRTLQQRGYIAEVGRDPGPGQATLFGTTNEFLERVGLAAISDLPPIGDLFPGTDIMEALERTLRADPVDRPPLDGQSIRAVAEDPEGLADQADPAADGASAVVPERYPPAQSLLVDLTNVADPGDASIHDDLAPPAWAVSDHGDSEAGDESDDEGGFNPDPA